MRISTSSLVDNMSSNIKLNLKKYQDLQNRISAGGQMLNPSDDPLAYSYINKLKDARNQIGQYSATAKKLKNDLDFYDNVFSEVTTLLRDIRTVALRASNSYIDDVDKVNLANEVNTKLQQIIALGNSNIQGKYMFAGSQNTVQPFEYVKNGDNIISVTYVGDNAQLHREVGFNDKVRVNFTGEEVFSNQSGAGMDIMNEVVALKSDILSGNIDAITSHLDNIDKSINQVASFQTENGNMTKHLQNLENTWSSLDIRYAENMDEVGVLDLATLINALNTQETTYQATLYIAANIGNVSLLNYMT